MKPAPIAAVRPRSRAWHSLVLAALVLAAGVIHQRATASGVFQSGGAWDKLATAVSGFRERMAQRRSAAQVRRDDQQRFFAAPNPGGFQPPWQQGDWRQRDWQIGRPCESWEVTWDDGCQGPYGWRHEDHFQPRWIDPPRHCGRWGGGW